MKTTFGTAAILLLGIGLLASCSAKKKSQGQVKVTKSKVSSSISKTSNSSFTKESIKTSQSTQSSSSSISTSTSHSTAPSNSSESASNVSSVPYGVSLVSENFPLTFYYKGFNVPESVTINDVRSSSIKSKNYHIRYHKIMTL